MATINFKSNSYGGEVLEDLLVYTTQGNDTYKEGLIHIKPGVQKKLTLPHVKLGKIIQDNVPTPTTQGAGAGGFNEYDHSERYLEPKDFMVYLEFNPRDYEEYWRPFQPEGELLFRDLDPKVQSTMLHLLIDQKDVYINDSIWGAVLGGPNAAYTSDDNTDTVLGGDCPAGSMKYFDGFMSRVLTNVNADPSTPTGAAELASGKVIIAGTTRMTTGAQVEAAMYAMWLATPKALRKSGALKFVMGWDVWDLYDQYLTSKDVKYTENADVNKMRFKGKEIKVINGIPEQTIALGKFTTGMDSCLWMAVDYATDQESVKVERLQANSELYFFQMRMKMDVNIARPGEIVVYSNYRKIVNAFAVAESTKTIAAGANAEIAYSNAIGTVTAAVSGTAKDDVTAEIVAGNKVKITVAAGATATETATVTLSDSAATPQTAAITVTVGA